MRRASITRHARTQLVAKVISAVGLMGLVGAMSACEDDVDDLLGPAGAVVTYSDPTVNFAALGTFSMPDTVIHFAPATGTPLAVSRDNDAAVLNQVSQNLISRGYVRVDAGTTQPSFVVLVGATAAAEYNAFVSYPWYSTWGFYSGWSWYAPGFTTGWGIEYPWYGTVGVTAYERGTLIVDLIPTVSVNPTTRTVRSAWVGVAAAVLDGTVSEAAVTGAVDQMFAQSPYLRTP